MSNNNLEVYVYEGNDGEEVPKSVEHLIVKDGVRILPNDLCRSFGYEYDRLRKVTFPDGLIKIGEGAFFYCTNLLEINKIPRTVEVIGSHAFASCEKLKKVEFEDDNGTSPHQLRTIGHGTFSQCKTLERVKLPRSVSYVGQFAFVGCSRLTEANLSATCITEIEDNTFSGCNSLQAVGLPKTIERIARMAFYNCGELVTVVVPNNSPPIYIDSHAFVKCKRLANFQLPENSRAHRTAFSGCDLLKERYGENGILAGLTGRFSGLPVHRICYDLSATTVQDLRQFIVNNLQEASGNTLVDEWGMTPYHVFLSTVEPTEEMLNVLLDTLPNQVLRCKDATGRRPVDLLVTKWTVESRHFLQIILQKSMIDPLASWSAKKEEMQNRVRRLLDQDLIPERPRIDLCRELRFHFVKYQDVESKSLLEQALWKWNLKSGWSNNSRKHQTLDREQCRCVSGSDVVIPNVLSFLESWTTP